MLAPTPMPPGITNTQSYAWVLRNVFFDALAADAFFAGYTCRKTPMNVVQQEHLPYLGVYIVDEQMLPNGVAKNGEPRFDHTLRIAFSVMIANNDMDAAETTLDAAWWKIMHRLWTDAGILNVYYSTNPDNTLIEALVRGVRRHVFGATQLNQQTPIAELRYEVSITFTTDWPPIIPDELKTIDVVTSADPRLPPVHVQYNFGPYVTPVTQRKKDQNHA